MGMYQTQLFLPKNLIIKRKNKNSGTYFNNRIVQNSKDTTFSQNGAINKISVIKLTKNTQTATSIVARRLLTAHLLAQRMRWW